MDFFDKGELMNSCYYYAFDDTVPAREINACSRESHDVPLYVNCAGCVSTAAPLSTDNRRGREDYYIMYIVDGALDVFIDGECKKASAGDTVIFPPRYRYRYSFGGDGRMSYLWVHFTGSYADAFLKKCLKIPMPNIIDTGASDKISSSFKRMFDIFEAGGRLRTEELASELERLILKIAKSCDPDVGKGFERSLKYIHSTYDRDISVEELAKLENISYYRYIKLFREAMGMPPAAYIIGIRMNTACELLHSTDMSVKQIGAAVGYSDAHFFSRIFKKHTGMSPIEYRENRK